MQAANTGVAQVAEDEPVDDAGGDHLVVDQVGGHAGQGEVLLALADDFVGGGEADEGGEAFDGDGCAVGDVAVDRFLHGDEFAVAVHRVCGWVPAGWVMWFRW